MTKIIAVRHAESIANTNGIYQGQTHDTGLSDLGKIQAKLLARELISYDIDSVLVSPLKRTFETATEISKVLGKKLEIRKEIIETNHGRWEGLKKDEIVKNYPEIMKLWENTPSRTLFPGGESFYETISRVEDFVNSKTWNGNTLLVTHDNIVRILVCTAMNMSYDKIWSIDLGPASITVFKILSSSDQFKLKLISVNIDDHLEGNKSDIATHAL